MTPIRRVSVAPVTDADLDTNLRAGDRLGTQLEWGVALPLTYQALQVPRPCAVMPVAPRRGDDPYVAIAYWTPLMHLLAYSLAWARPYRGLRRWYEAGNPADGAVLTLISDVWAADGQLDWFVAWMHSHDPDWTEAFAGIAAPTGPPPARPGDPEWLADAVEACEASGIPAPLAGGSDPLHLGYHWNGPLTDHENAAMLVRSRSIERTSAFIAEHGLGWYRQLATLAGTLPALHGLSWHVDVVVRSLGHLGTYRRSRRTGLWFTGRHAIHMLGN